MRKLPRILLGDPTSRTGVRRAMVRAVVVPVALMALLCVVFLYQSRQLLILGSYVDHADQVIAAAQTVQKQVLDLETGLRGYLLTGEEPFLEPYRSGLAALPASLGRLDGLVAGDPGQRARLESVRGALEEWQRLAAGIIERRRAAKDYLIEIRAQSTKRRMDSLRAVFGEMIAAEEGLREERRRTVERNARRTIWGSMALAAFWGTMLAFGLRRQILSVSHSYERAIADVEAARRELAESHQLLETRVQERTAALTAANAELEAFCYSVSHDLRAPLRGIDGFSQAIVEDYGARLDPTARQYLGYVRDGVQRMGRLIDDLLNLSRLSRMELRREPVSLRALASGIDAELRREHPGRRVEFANLAEGEGEVQGDPGLLAALLENLLSNAWKFTAGRETAEIRLAQETRDGETVYSVRDNGAGFDMAFEAKLFGAFQRLHTDKEFPGTGVGLATVRRIVHRHGGRVWAQGKVGEGAVFFFTLT